VWRTAQGEPSIYVWRHSHVYSSGGVQDEFADSFPVPASSPREARGIVLAKRNEENRI
jgi:hypothetical protein